MFNPIKDFKFKDSESWAKILVSLFFLVLILRTLSKTVADPDLWGYLAFGKLFWETGKFPYQDVFSYVPTHPVWIYHEWLTGVIFYPLYNNWGAASLQLLKYGFGLATLGLVYATARQRGASFLGTVIVLLVAKQFLAIGYSPVRAQLCTFFFFTLTLYLLERARLSENWRLLWILVPVQVIWCNLHGGFPAGLGLTGIYAAGEALSRRPFRPYLKILFFSTLVTLINPYGPQYWPYIIYANTVPRHEITEWVSFYQSYQLLMAREEVVYYLGTLIFTAALMWWGKFREITAGLALAVTFVLGMKHSRHIVFFLMLMGAYLPVVMTAYLAVLKSRPQFMSFLRRLGWKIPVLVGLSVVIIYGYKFISHDPLSLTIPDRPGQGVDYKIFYPVGAVGYIQQENLRGNLLTEFDWGNYLLWMLYPQCKVALDGRFESVYSVSINQEYSDFKYGRPNWRQFLEKYPPDLILIYLESKTYQLVKEDPQWRQVYADSGSALFRRK
jgi:hypothetical protein